VEYSKPEPENLPNGAPYGADKRTRANGSPGAHEHWLRSAVQNSMDIVKIVGPEGTLRYANPAWGRVLGHDAAEMVGAMNVLDYVHPDDLPRVREQLGKTLSERGNSATRIEYRFLHADGSWRWMESVGTYLLDDPAQGGVVVNSRDITARKEAEEALEAAEVRYRTLVEHIPVVTYIDKVSDQDTPLYTSPQIEEMLGYTPEEWLTEKLWPKRLHPEDEARILAADERFETSGEPFGEEYRLLAKDGSVVWVREEAVLVEDDAGEPLYWQGVILDITEQKSFEEQLKRWAFHDRLTGLPNRQLFVDRLGQALRRTRRSGRQVAVLFMDLDGFKVVNDSLGHETGDLLLVALGERLGRCLRPEDTLARFGGDEFVVLLEGVQGRNHATQVADRIAESLKRPFLVGGRELFVNASVGIALGMARTKGPEDLLRDADTAMYQAKDGRVAGYKVFDPGMRERVLNRLGLENDLRRAVEHDEFRLYYQPKVSLKGDTVSRFEVLLRWQHPQRGLLMPDEFIPMAEETGMIVPVGEWVLQETCRQVKEWQDRYPSATPLVACVNVSAGQLRNPDLLQEVGSALGESGIETRNLVLEITESALVEDAETSMTLLRELRDSGVRIALDDFGSEYSSLYYLMQLPMDFVQIDKQFVWSLAENSKARVIVQAIISLAHSLGLEAVGEGVESAEQLEILRSMACDLVQGNYLARPMPPEELGRMLGNQTAP
jgi:diguanylate cyclase (GGDEF)-like protein/PAS domain S-box-containing protein